MDGSLVFAEESPSGYSRSPLPRVTVICGRFTELPRPCTGPLTPTRHSRCHLRFLTSRAVISVSAAAAAAATRLDTRRVSSLGSRRMTYRVPGVYIGEVTAGPPSVEPVATAAPVFIGYTEDA